MKKKFLFIYVVFALMVVIGLGSPTTASAKNSFSGEYRQGEILSFGSSLTDSEELALRVYFGVPTDMDAIYVDNETAIKQLGLAPNALDNYTGGWYSSAYVKLTNQGGIDVSSKNVSLVTNEMFANALITSGILNCNVTISAPFMVTGESALAGILAGIEEIMGESLSEENKVVAKEEIDTTLEVADDILNSSDNDIDSTGDSSNVASGIINDIKQQVIKDSPNSTQIQEIIINVTNNYGVELSEETNARVLSLMEDVNDLDIDYKDIKDTMQNIGDSISNSLKDAGIKLKESGFFENILNWFSDLFKNLMNWIKNLFTSSTPDDSLNLNDNISPEIDETPVPEDDAIENETHDVFETEDLEQEQTDSTLEEPTEDVVEDENKVDETVEESESEVETEVTPEEVNTESETAEKVAE
ncbi:MAG: DUF1002 domain-containing protein [Turicibacter sp.]